MVKPKMMSAMRVAFTPFLCQHDLSLIERKGVWMALASKPLTRSIVILLIATPLTACSSMGTAVVTEIDGLPCFSIPKSWTTRNGLPMHGLTVVQRNAPGAAPYSKYVWTFSVEPAGASIITRPGKCMRYGATPRFANQGESQPLEPFQVYSVFINARPDDSGMRGYIADVLHQAGRRREAPCAGSAF